MDAILLDRADNLTDTAGDNGLPTRSPRLSDDLFLCTGVLTSEETEGAVSDITLTQAAASCSAKSSLRFNLMHLSKQPITSYAKHTGRCIDIDVHSIVR